MSCPRPIFLSSAFSSVALDALERREFWFPEPCHYPRVIDFSADVYRPDGTLLLALRKGGASLAHWRSAYDAVTRNARRVDPKRGRRKAAAGQKNFRSGTIGFMHGGHTFAARADPRGWDELAPLVRTLDDVFRDACPDEYGNHHRVVNSVPDRFMVPGTRFGTVQCNRHDPEAGCVSRMGCHRDQGNLPGAYGVMSVVGTFTGGLLVFPRYRVAVDLRPLDVLIADNTELHGNTPIHGRRLSVVAFVHATNRIAAGTVLAGGPGT